MKTIDITEEDSRFDAECLEAWHGKRLNWTLKQMSTVYLMELAGVYFGSGFASRTLLKSIAKHGIRQPIVFSRGILEGNHRLAAATTLKLPTAPVYIGK
jgi:hypothetical protein